MGKGKRKVIFGSVIMGVGVLMFLLGNILIKSLGMGVLTIGGIILGRALGDWLGM